MFEKHLITANTILYCMAWEKTVEFYRDRLKLPVIFSTDWLVEFSLNASLKLSIADEKQSSIRGCSGQGITVSLEVDNVRAMREWAEDAGLNPTELKRHPWNAQVFYIFDPEGHRIEIWQRIKTNTNGRDIS